MLELPEHWKPWIRTGIALPLIVLNSWVLLQAVQYFEPLVTIFALSAVFAFILNYPVRFLQNRGLPHIYAVLLVLLLSLLVLVLLGITLVPVLLGQLTEITTLLPDWLDAASQKLQLLENWAADRRMPINLSQIVTQLEDRLPAEVQAIADQSLPLALEAVDSLSDLVLTAVLTLYLLFDGSRVWNAIFERLPLLNRDRVQSRLYTNFHSYFIGQAALGVWTGSVLAVAFLVLKVPYSLLLGLLVGIMTLIPFGDVISFILISLSVAIQDAGLGIRTLVVAAVLDQLTDQLLAPRILGGFTGLRPIWVIIALLLGTKLFGLAGLLIAVPIAGSIKDLLDNPLSDRELPLPFSQLCQEDAQLNAKQTQDGTTSPVETGSGKATIS
jgi:predicted PurR-regulated permease PerM